MLRRLAALVALPLACVPKPPGSPKGDIVLGGIFSHSGTLAAVDQGIENAAMMAIADINAAGGINGRLLALEVRDGKSDPAAAKAAAQELVAAGVPVIIAGVSSGFADVLLGEVLDRNQTLYFGGAATSIYFRAADKYPKGFLYRVMGSDLTEGKLMARIACEKGYKTMAKLSVDNPYGNGMVDAAAKEFVRIGGQVVSTQKYPEVGPPTSFTGISSAIDSAQPKPHGVFWASYPAEGAQIAKDWKNGGYTWKLLGAHSLQNQQFLSNAGLAAEGLEGVSQYFVPSPRVDQFTSDYRVRYGGPPVPPPYVHGGYDMVALVALAIAKAGEATAPKIEAVIREVSNAPGDEFGYGSEQLKAALQAIAAGKDVNYQGVSGPIELDEAGDAQTAYQIWKVEGGKFAPPIVITDVRDTCRVQ